MSSYIMHMCISNIVKEKLNLTDQFIYGSVLPDLLKEITGDRTKTHYIQKCVIDGDTRNLPDIQKAIEDLDKRIPKYIRLGYIAHLIEDKIWFNEYIPTYAKRTDDGTFIYICNNSIHTPQEFRETMYKDYLNSSGYVVKKSSTDISILKEGIYPLMDKAEGILLDKNTKCVGSENITSTVFMTKDNIDKYIDETVEEVIKGIKEMLGE